MDEKAKEAIERLGFAVRDAPPARRFVFGMPLEYANRNWAKDKSALAVLAEMAKENELNKMLINDLTRDMNEYHDKAEKAEAELAHAKEVAEGAGYRLQNAEAKLAKWGPVIKAAEKAKLFPAPTDGRTCIDSHDEIIRAALECREEGA